MLTDLERSRFVFRPDYRHARYIIVDNFTMDYMFRQGTLQGLVKDIGAEAPVSIFESGEFKVLEYRRQ